MKEVLILITEQVVLVIDAIALLVIAYGTIQAFFGMLPHVFGSRSAHERRALWLRYGHWLITGLTFQLAADIVETSIGTSWEAIGRLAAIAVIRTFLNYFLERDMSELREREKALAER